METTHAPRFHHDCVILGNGSYPTHPLPVEILRQAPYLCCCDGAALQHLQGGGQLPDAIVGDGDSLPTDFKERYADRLHIVREQIYNDLTKATRFCVKRGFHDIAYVGCQGKREDHALGNFSLMAFYLREFGISPVMYTDYGIFIPAQGTRTFPCFPRQQVSIFNMDCTTLTSEGLRWQSYPYAQLWQGTLNEPLGDSFTLHADQTYIVFLTYEGKQ